MLVAMSFSQSLLFIFVLVLVSAFFSLAASRRLRLRQPLLREH